MRSGHIHSSPFAFLAWHGKLSVSHISIFPPFSLLWSHSSEFDGAVWTSVLIKFSYAVIYMSRNISHIWQYNHWLWTTFSSYCLQGAIAHLQIVSSEQSCLWFYIQWYYCHMFFTSAFEKSLLYTLQQIELTFFKQEVKIYIEKEAKLTVPEVRSTKGVLLG